jgi:protoporphyrinogen IX oxidase
MEYLWFKSLHIIGFTSWMAGLFYLPRIFIYHVEANEQPEPIRSALKAHYNLTGKRLYTIITTPAMVVTILMAIGILTTEPDVLQEWWLHVKLVLVGLMVAYHFYCNWIRTQLAKDTFTWTSKQLRIYNEVSTLIFIPIVLLAIFKGQFPTDLVTWLIAALVIVFLVIIQLYAKKRREDKEKLKQGTP